MWEWPWCRVVFGYLLMKSGPYFDCSGRRVTLVSINTAVLGGEVTQTTKRLGCLVLTLLYGTRLLGSNLPWPHVNVCCISKMDKHPFSYTNSAFWTYGAYVWKYKNTRSFENDAEESDFPESETTFVDKLMGNFLTAASCSSFRCAGLELYWREQLDNFAVTWCIIFLNFFFKKLMSVVQENKAWRFTNATEDQVSRRLGILRAAQYDEWFLASYFRISGISRTPVQ